MTMRKYSGLKRAIDVLTLEINITANESKKHPPSTDRGFRLFWRGSNLRAARAILKRLSAVKVEEIS